MIGVTNKQIAMRLGQMVLVLLGISFITFCLVMLAPGDPVRQMIAGNEDIVVSQVEIDALRHELGLDQPFLMQYLSWLGRVLHGNFGFSFMMKKPVLDAVLEALPATVILALASSVFMLLFAIPLGIYTAVKQNTWADYIIRGFTFAGVSVPNFWMGLMLLWIFALKLNLFPIVGGDVSVENLILPMVTLGVVMASKYTRQVRATVLEELQQDYVMGARARGFSESHILWKEVLPNALLPLITLLGLAFGSLLGGAAVVEIVFSWPGLGFMVVQAITYRDFQTVQAVVLWIAFMYMAINLVVDLSYNHLDPRLRKAGQ
ncbi:nickel ABC transporter permease [Dialister invisus]|jgi:peptide/nickel transport system permease protein|uniref:nickel ABC transporter permease n=1 Tax=Dialister invisus TaxID=218538 RepID=UPI00258A5BB2|nr:nickel ABC transporter permease [uncultured Dialister sp.]